MAGTSFGFQRPRGLEAKVSLVRRVPDDGKTDDPRDGLVSSAGVRLLAPLWRSALATCSSTRPSSHDRHDDAGSSRCFRTPHHRAMAGTATVAGSGEPASDATRQG